MQGAHAPGLLEIGIALVLGFIGFACQFIALSNARDRFNAELDQK